VAATVCGLVGSLSKIFSVALLGAPALPAGEVNCTVIVQCWPIVSITEPFKHVLFEPLNGSTAYCADAVPVIVGVEVKLNVVVPSLVTVTDRFFVIPPVTVPNASDPVIFTSVPVPVTGNCNDVTPFGSPVKFAVIVPGITPVEVGVKATLNVQVWPVVSANGCALQLPLVKPV